MANHSKEKPHKCEYCLKTFRRKDYLKQHILYHKDVTHPLFQPDSAWPVISKQSGHVHLQFKILM